MRFIAIRQKNRCLAVVHHYLLSGLPFILILLLTACFGGHSDQDQAPVNPDALPVTVLEVWPTSAPRVLETIGQTEGAKEVEVRPRVGGILLKHLYEEGANVLANQPLFLIDPVPFEIALQRVKAQLAEQQAKVSDAKREVIRMRRLLAENFVSQRMFDTATTTFTIEEAALKDTLETVKQAQLNLSYTKVTAPVAGVSGRAHFSEGSLVEAQNTLLTTIQQITPIWVRFSLSDHELIKLGGQLTEQAVTAVNLMLPDGKIYPLGGQINFAASSIDPLLGTQQLRAVFDNPDRRLLPGQFVRVQIQTGEYDNIFLIPQTAVLAEDIGKYVYIANEENEAVKRHVVAGAWVGKNWIILDGLETGDHVITDNLIKLRPGAAIEPQITNYGTQ